jgi:hypothetical protein
MAFTDLTVFLRMVCIESKRRLRPATGNIDSPLRDLDPSVNLRL